MITEDDYIKAIAGRSMPLLWQHIRARATTKSFLFIGYSQSDQHVASDFKVVSNLLQNLGPESFLISPNISQEWAMYLQQQHITPIEMTANDALTWVFTEVRRSLLHDIREGILSTNMLPMIEASMGINLSKTIDEHGRPAFLSFSPSKTTEPPSGSMKIVFDTENVLDAQHIASSEITDLLRIPAKSVRSFSAEFNGVEVPLTTPTEGEYIISPPGTAHFQGDLVALSGVSIPATFTIRRNGADSVTFSVEANGLHVDCGIKQNEGTGTLAFTRCEDPWDGLRACRIADAWSRGDPPLFISPDRTSPLQIPMRMGEKIALTEECQLRYEMYETICRASARFMFKPKLDWSDIDKLNIDIAILRGVLNDAWIPAPEISIQIVSSEQLEAVKSMSGKQVCASLGESVLHRILGADIHVGFAIATAQCAEIVNLEDVVKQDNDQQRQGPIRLRCKHGKLLLRYWPTQNERDAAMEAASGKKYSKSNRTSNKPKRRKP